MKEYIPLLEAADLFIDGHPFDTGATEEDMIKEFPVVIKPFIQRLLQLTNKIDSEGEIQRSVLPAIQVYVKDYGEDLYFKFLNTVISKVGETSGMFEDLDAGGQEVYKTLQTQGEELFYDLLGTHINQKIYNNEIVGQSLENLETSEDEVNADQKKQNKKYISADLKNWDKKK